jgi:hypothetical protein
MSSAGTGGRENKEGAVPDRSQLARDVYLAFASGDRAGYFERCWPAAGGGQEFDFVRVVESGDEVVVTYELRHADGTGGRNTEVLTFSGDKLCRADIYFGWNIQ